MRSSLFNTAPTRTSPTMPVQSQLFEEAYYHPYQYTAGQRYAHGSFASAPSTAGASLLNSTSGESLTSYASRQSWSSGSQHGSEYDSPSGTPYSEYGPPLEHDYYPSTTTSQTVAYPESSQRTHVSDTAYSSLYGARVYTAGARVSSASARSSHTPEEEQTSYRFPSSPQHSSPAPASESQLRGGNGAWQDFSAPASSYSRSTMVSQLGNIPAIPASRSAMPAQQDVHSAYPGRVATRPSPTLPSHLRLHGSLGEPGNPSVVPPLVYDEEFDDESECSVPSAASADVYRSAYHMQSSPQSSPDGSAGALSVSSSADNNGEMHSPTPPPESALSSPTMTSDRSLADRSKGACQKKSKMHQCVVCGKWFPRPSGLATHMNSHSGAKRT